MNKSNIPKINSMECPYSIFYLTSNTEQIPKKMYRKIPLFNLVIEFNGRQHYEPVNRFGGFDGLLETQRRDKIKREYLKENNIKLLEIHYLDKEIEKTILTIINIE